MSPIVTLLAALAAAPQFAQDPAPGPDAAWSAAHALKSKADYERAAAAFDAFARAHPADPRAAEARVEHGVCWFSLGRARQELQQNTPASLAAFERARTAFEAVTQETPTAAVAGRAQYMRGTVALFAGDLVTAEREYGRGLELYASDTKYLPKSLERRAAVRRHLLRTADARSDLERYLRDFGSADDAASARRYLQMLGQFEQIAPPLSPGGTWIQGGPLSLTDLRGDVVILNFFATWCENCEKARPFLQDLVKRFRPMGVRMIGIVDYSKGQTVESVRAFLPTKGIDFPVLMDQGQTTAAYLGQKIPDIVILDRLGRVRWHDNPANLQDATLELLLTEDPTAVPTRPPSGK